MERSQFSAGGAGRPCRSASDPRQELPPDRPGAGCGQERCPSLGEARHGCYEKIFEKRIAIEDEKKDGFGQVFKSALQAVNDKQVYSDEMTNKLVLGEDVEIHEVMLAAEEASLALQTAVQVRNKLTEAIKELTNLQI